MSVNDFTTLMTKEEKLVPELLPYVTSSTLGFPVLHHPLMIEIMVNVERAAMINYRFKVISEEVQGLWERGDLRRWVFRHERPYRLDAFLIFMKSKPKAAKVSDRVYWECLKDIWVDSENIFQHKKDWRRLLRSKRPGKGHLMGRLDKERLSELAEHVRVFRGTSDKGDVKGLSWTLSEEKARWFANRFAKSNKYLVHGEVKKSDIDAVFLDRNEDEVVSSRVKVLRIQSI